MYNFHLYNSYYFFLNTTSSAKFIYRGPIAVLRKTFSTTFFKVILLLLLLSRFSLVQLFVIPWTIAHQAPLSMGFPKQEYWSGLPFPSPEDFPDPGIKLMSLVSLVLAGGFFTTEPPEKSKWSYNSGLITLFRLLHLTP